MPEKDPLEEILTQITDILEFVQDNRAKVFSSNVPLEKEIVEDLEKLEKTVEEFKNLAQEAMKLEGLDQEKLKEMVQNPSPGLTRVQVRSIERAKKLKKEFTNLQKQMAASRTLALLKHGKTASEDSIAKNRMKKFRRVGGKKDWKPL